MEINKKIIVIGLDGATFDLINPLIKQGKLPNLEKLIKGGASGELKSTIPPVSAAAWISFFTGKNPGSHGAFNFRTFDLKKYSSFNEDFVTTDSIPVETIFEILSRHNLRVGSLGVPMTYPPLKVNGFMIASGVPLTVINESTVYPPELLKKIGKFEMPAKIGRENRDYFLSYMTENLNKHLEISEKMLKEEEYSFFMVGFANTDWAIHQYWEYSDPAFPTYDKNIAEKYKKVIEEQYIAVDKAVGRLMSYADSDTLLMVMSDHGAGSAPTKCLNINTWLKKAGFLKTRGSFSIFIFNALGKFVKYARDKLSRYKTLKIFLILALPRKIKENISSLRLNTKNIFWKETKAYWVPFIPMFDGIVINKKGKQPSGIVEDEKEYEKLRNHIIEGLLKINDPITGQPVVSNVFKKEEVYRGKFIDNAPDLIVMFKEGYTGNGKFSSNLIESIEKSSLSNSSGYHRLNGIFIAYGNGVKENEKITGAEIIDLAPTILYFLDLEIPSDMEGKILKDIFRPDFIAKFKEKYEAGREKNLMGQGSPHLGDEEREKIKKVLGGLGYL